jgi:hypothetical protein
LEEEMKKLTQMSHRETDIYHLLTEQRARSCQLVEKRRAGRYRPTKNVKQAEIEREMDRLRATIDTYRSWLDLRVDDVLRGRMRRVPGDWGLAEELREVFKSNLLIIDIYDRDFIDREWTLDELIKKLREYLSHLEKEAYPTKDVLL